MGFAQTSVPYNWTFKQIKQDPLRDLEAVKASRDILFAIMKPTTALCSSMISGSDGILVESEGYGIEMYTRNHC